MSNGWETIKVLQLRQRLKSLRDRFNELPNTKEVQYREYVDSVTKEIVIRIIPHTGVHPNG